MKGYWDRGRSSIPDWSFRLPRVVKATGGWPASSEVRPTMDGQMFDMNPRREGVSLPGRSMKT